MSKITLDEALRLLEEKKAKVNELLSTRQTSGVVSYEDGEDESFIQRPERTVEEITKEIQFVSRQVRKLQLAITKANVEIETEIELDSEKLTLGELIVAIKQLRVELPYLQKLTNNKNSKQKKKNREYVDGQFVHVTTIYVNEVLYNIQDVRESVAKSEKLIQKMQATINKLNVETYVDFVNEEFKA